MAAGGAPCWFMLHHYAMGRPLQCYDEAALLMVRADRTGCSSGEQVRALCVQAAALLKSLAI
jgi:hypothetical protein